VLEVSGVPGVDPFGVTEGAGEDAAGGVLVPAAPSASMILICLQISIPSLSLSLLSVLLCSSWARSKLCKVERLCSLSTPELPMLYSNVVGVEGASLVVEHAHCLSLQDSLHMVRRFRWRLAAWRWNLPPNQFHTSPTRFRDKDRDKIKFKLLFVAVSFCVHLNSGSGARSGRVGTGRVSSDVAIGGLGFDQLLGFLYNND
jgi:hypothetical protein